MRFPRAVLLSVVGLIAVVCCASFPREGRLTQQYVTSPLLENALDFLYFTIARKANMEAWFCVKGFVDPRNGNAILQTLSPIFVDSAGVTNVYGRPLGCSAGADSVSIVGTVHFHPDMNQCEFSDDDIMVARWLPYKLTAIMCREDADTVPHLMVAFRRQIDSVYAAIKKSPNGVRPSAHTEATYRFTKRAAPPKT